MESDTIIENIRSVSESVTDDNEATATVDNVAKEDDYVDSYNDDDENVSVKNEYLMEISSEHGERDIGSAYENQEDDDDEEDRPLKIVGFGSDDGDGDNDDNKISDDEEQRGSKRKFQSEGDEDEISSEDEEDGFAGFEENPDEEESRQNSKRFASSNEGSAEQQPSNPQITNNTVISNNTNNNIPKSPAFVAKKGGGPRTIPLTDPIYAKPFEYGWKRELVLRAIPEASKEKGEIYYIAPNGKRLRTRHDIYVVLSQLGKGNLTLDNFTFSKEPLGLTPDKEIIRSAKLLTNATKKTELEISNITHSKRIPKPKVPKGASPPPPTTPSINRSLSHKTLRNVTTGPSTPSTNVEPPSFTTDKKSKSKRKSCTIQCVLAMGTIPTLQCKSCAWLYHHECYGVEINSAESFHFICEVCKLEKLEERQKVNPNPNEQLLNDHELENLSPIQPQQQQQPHLAPTPVQSEPPATNQIILNRKENVVDSLTTWHHHTTNISTNQNVFNVSDIPPQTIASIDGRKFIVVPKTNVLSVSPPRDSSSMSTSLKTDNFNNYGFNNFSISRRNSNTAPNEESNCEHTFNNDTSATGPATSPISHHDTNSLSRKKSGSRTPKSSSVIEAESLDVNNLGKLKSVATNEVGTTHFSKNFFANLSIGYDVLLHTFQYLKVQELLRAGCVCRLWNQAANNAILWRTVRMKNSQVNDWLGFAHTLIKNGTKYLDLRKMLSPKNNPEETWQKFSQSIGKIKNLETIDLCKCSVKVVESLFETNHNLRVLNAVTLKDDIINLKNIANLNLLTELRLKSTLGLIINDLAPLQNLQSMRHLSLTSIKDLGSLNLDVLGKLTNLESLELGECSEFSTNFVSSVLVKLDSLQRLRLEKGQDNCCTFDILTGVSKMENLIQLELINFDIKADFDEHLAKCTNIKKLLLIPTYVSQSATTNQTVLNAVMKLTDSLTNFTWAVTSELVRVTELYVDNCESNRRNKKALSDCIPILKPVPGILDTTQIMSKRAKSDVPQVEILPLTSVEKILSTALPAAKVNMIIIAFHATWRQSLVEN